MKRFLPAMVLISLLLVPTVSLAVKCSDFDSNEAECLKKSCMWNPDTNECEGIYIEEAGDVIDIINRVGNWIFAIVMAIAGIMLILAGFFWVTAGGDPEKLRKAQQTLTNAVIGLVVALLAKGLVMAIVKVLGA